MDHHKIAVLLPALAHLRKIELMSGLFPPERFFHKPRGDPANFGVLKVTPRVVPLVKNFDALEHVARNMFISRTQTWRRGVAYVLPLNHYPPADLLRAACRNAAVSRPDRQT